MHAMSQPGTPNLANAPSAPFRTQLRTAPMLAEERKFLEKIQNREHLSRESITHAIDHPNESIPVALIEHYHDRLASLFTWNLYRRGLEICEKEQIARHPIFDAMAYYEFWPNRDRVGAHLASKVRTIDTHIEPVVDWIKSITNPVDLAPLLQFRSLEIRKAIALHANTITPELIERLPLEALLANPNLPEELIPHIAKKAIAQLVAHEDNFATEPYEVIDAANAIKALGQNGRHIPADLIDRLIAKETVDKRLCVQALTELGSQVSQEQLITAFDNAEDQFTRELLINHPAATTEFQRRAIQSLITNAPIQDLTLKTPPLSDSDLYRLMSENDMSERKGGDTTATQEKSKNADGHALAKTELLKYAMVSVASSETDLFLSVLKRFIATDPARVASKVVGFSRALHYEIMWRDRVRKYHLETLVEEIVGTKNRRALEYLLQFPHTADDPRIHQALLEFPDLSIVTLRSLMVHARGRSFRQAFARVFASDRWAGPPIAESLKYLNQHSAPGIFELTPEDIAPFLQSTHKEARVQALILLSRIQARKPRIETQSTTTRLRTRTQRSSH